MVTYNRQFGLQADAHGFLISQNRLERATRDMGQDVKRMVDVLEDMRNQREENPPSHHLSGLALVLAQAARQQPTIDIVQALRDVQDAIIQRPTIDVRTPEDLIVRPTSDQNRQPTPTPPLPRPTIDVRTPDDLVVPTAPTSNNQPAPPDATPNTDPPAPDTPTPDATPNSDPPTPDATPATPPVPPTRERGSDGRFGSGSKNQSWFDRFKNAVSGGVKDGMPDTRGVDPTVDAINELGTLFSPVTKMAGFVLKPIGALWRSRKKKEPLSDDENRHNRRQLGLLDRIANALGRNSANGSAGLGNKTLPAVVTTVVVGAAAQAVEKINQWNEENNNPIGELVAKTLALFGNEEAKNAVKANKKDDPPPLVSDSPANQSWDERWLVLKAAFGSEDARKALREKYPKNSAGYYGMPLGSKEAALAKLQGSTAKTDYSKAPKGKLSPEKAKKISEVAGRIGVDPNDLASIISFETVGTFSPSIRNPESSATGLIQFMGKGATKKGKYNDGTYYGMSRGQFGALSFDEQMAYVEKYYQGRGFDGKRKRSLAEAYTAVTGYGYKAGSAEYAANEVWDANGNNVIDKDEAVLAPEFQAHIKKWIPDSEPVAPKKEAPKPTPKPEEDDWALSGIMSSAKDYWFGSDKPATPTPAFVDKVAPMAPVSAIPPAPDVKAPMRLPPPPAPKPAPERLGSQRNNQQPQTTAFGDGISQNVSDRDIAHAVTGGIGMRSWNG